MIIPLHTFVNKNSLRSPNVLRVVLTSLLFVLALLSAGAGHAQVSMGEGVGLVLEDVTGGWIRPPSLGVFGLGSTGLMIIVAVAILLVFLSKGGLRMGLNWFGAGLGPALALKDFKYDMTAGTVQIKGRQPGIKAFVLSAMGLDATTSLNVEPRQIAYRTASLSGEDHISVPTPCIATLSCGFNKPLGYLVAAAIFFLVGIYGGFAFRGGAGGMAAFAGLVMAAIYVALYFLSKKIYISIITNGGNMIGIRFKRSIIENVSVDIDKVKDIITLMRMNVMACHAGSVAAPVAATTTKSCPKCGVQLAQDDMFCGECGTRF